MDFDDTTDMIKEHLGDAMSYAYDAHFFIKRVRRDGLLCTAAPIAARHAAEAALVAGGTAVATSIAYGGVGGTLLHLGVAAGLCSPPLVVAAVPAVAIVGGLVVGRRVARRLRGRKR